MSLACPRCGRPMDSEVLIDGSTEQSCACGARVIIPRQQPVESLERRVESLELSVRQVTGNAEDQAKRLVDVVRRLEALEAAE
jgi:hypothetical protein